MKKIDQNMIDAIRDHVKGNPSSSYKQVAISFGLSEITVKRYCADLGRGKAWRLGRKQATPNADKFWLAVDCAGTGCWEWKGCRNNSGYGFVHFDGKSHAAHRVAYTLVRGEIPDGLELDHRCRNRACCNPDHLEAITHSENMERVRLAKAMSVGVGQHPVPDLIDRGSENEAGQKMTNETAAGVATTLIPERTLHAAPHTEAWTSARSSYRWAHVDNMFAKEKERMATEDAEDDRWGLSHKQLGTKDSWPTKLRSFWVIFPHGLHLELPARSAEDLKAMVASICGSGHGIGVEEEGPITDVERVSRMLFGWRPELTRQFETWKATDQGERWVTESEEKCRAAREQQRIDDEVNAYFDFEEEHLAQLQTKRPAEQRRPRRVQPERRRATHFDSDDYGTDSSEMDY